MAEGFGRGATLGRPQGRAETPPAPSRRPHGRRGAKVLLLASLVALSSGCQSGGDAIGYYWQSVSGHLELLRKAEPIPDLVAQPQTEPGLRARLELAQRVRRFAIAELGLPDNGSYTRFAALDRPFVVWSVVAAPELSLELRRWCFPVAGCVSYRGYYAEAAARQYAEGLAGEGFDVQVSGVPAYSTLGWFDDPLLSTFIHYPDPELARLVFHELSHQVVYVKGDSQFNESFATAVEQLGVERWLAAQGTPAQREAWMRQQRRRGDFLALLRRHRAELAAIYAGPGEPQAKREAKKAQFERLRSDYRRLRDTEWQGFAGFDRWFDRPLGNAHLGAVATYTEWVPAFRRLFDEAGGDFRRFYASVEQIARLAPAERQAALRQKSDVVTMAPDRSTNNTTGADPVGAREETWNASG